MSSRFSFFAELKRRNVYKVAVAYAVGGWALAQGIAQVLPVFDVPNWIVRLIVLAIILGFPVALAISWAFELTPEGFKRTEEAHLATEPSRNSRTWIYVVVIGALFSASLFFLGRYSVKSGAIGASPPGGGVPQKSIAVLPLLNESGDPRDEYFSDGLSEELIAALGQIKDLKVIGRSSSFRYKARKEDAKIIAGELGVSTLLEGTVRKQGDRVRIVAELINAADGIQLWAQPFDRELKDIFAVQEEISRAVADSLNVTLLGSDEKATTNAAPKSVDAHNAYLQGHFVFLRRNLDDYRRAVTYFDAAIQLDPDYALAYAERSEAWTLIADLTGEHDKGWPIARSDAEKAVTIAPTIAEPHAALGWVRFFVDWKFAEGLKELKRAKKLSPANPT